jgi:thiamine biosynthesis lipoprotein
MLSALGTHTFRSMGTEVSLTGPTGPGFDDAAAALEEVFVSMDHRFSRFRADSELTAVNDRAGGWVKLSPQFATVLILALDGARRTGGLFDPTVLPALLAAGYDRDFAELPTLDGPAAAPPKPGDGWRRIRLGNGSMRAPRGVQIDFGGVAKGWAADRGAEAVAAHLPWAVVDAGGDLRVAGDPGNDGLAVAIEDPWDRSREVMRLALVGGAVATSSVTTRTWGPGLHQVIDPRTSRPSVTDVVQATAWAPTCAEAEIDATWLLLGGLPVLDRVPGLLVMTDGRVVTNLEPPADVSSTSVPVGVAG